MWRANGWSLALVAVLGMGSSGCRGGNGSVDDLAEMELTRAALPTSPTNRYADSAPARELGRALFFEKGLSSDGTISCASCHKAADGFSDPHPFSAGVGGQLGDRHAMTVAAAAFHPFLLSDGKADSAWLQPLKALENLKEMAFSRVEVARFIAARYRAPYEATFGPLPSFEGVPASGQPGVAAWEALDATKKDAIQRVFVNVGKSIEAYERALTCSDTRFDRWNRGEVQLTAAEQRGATAFVNNGCMRCHSGPSFSDGKFHDLGIDSNAAGRTAGIQALLADPFNGAGVYSDNRPAGAARLEIAAQEEDTNGQFRTASLRGAGQRRFFGHLGNHETLRDFIQNVYRGGGGNRGRNGATTDPLLRGVTTNNLDELVAFIRTLDCPTPPRELQAP